MLDEKMRPGFVLAPVKRRAAGTVCSRNKWWAIRRLWSVTLCQEGGTVSSVAQHFINVFAESRLKRMDEIRRYDGGYS